MASLYIKDPETAALAERIARIQGKTKTQAVKDALRKVEAETDTGTTSGSSLVAHPRNGRNFVEWLAEWHAHNPRPPATGPLADKAFYDSLSDEDNL